MDTKHNGGEETTKRFSKQVVWVKLRSLSEKKE
jgi:hypothetical protein